MATALTANACTGGETAPTEPAPAVESVSSDHAPELFVQQLTDVIEHEVNGPRPTQPQQVAIGYCALWETATDGNGQPTKWQVIINPLIATNYDKHTGQFANTFLSTTADPDSNRAELAYSPYIYAEESDGYLRQHNDHRAEEGLALHPLMYGPEPTAISRGPLGTFEVSLTPIDVVRSGETTQLRSGYDHTIIIAGGKEIRAEEVRSDDPTAICEAAYKMFY